MTQKITVLMVDDEERFRVTTAKILERKGFQVLLAESGEEALEKIKEKPDVVILDIRMAGMDGEEALAHIKKRNPNIPVIMLTGHGELPSAERTLEHGAFDYLSKPADIDLLTYKINEAVRFGGGAKKDQEMVVGDLMIPIEEYVVVSVDTPLKNALFQLRDTNMRFQSTDKFMQSGHREILVVDKGEIVGMVSMKEIADKARPSYLDQIRSHEESTALRYSHIFWNGMLTMRLKEIAGIRIGDVMAPPPPGIDKNANLTEACDRLHEKSARRLIVTAENKVVGVLREQELFFEMIRILSQ